MCSLIGRRSTVFVAIGHHKSNHPVFQGWRSSCKSKLWLRKLCSGFRSFYVFQDSEVSGTSIGWLAICNLYQASYWLLKVDRKLSEWFDMYGTLTCHCKTMRSTVPVTGQFCSRKLICNTDTQVAVSTDLAYLQLFSQVVEKHVCSIDWFLKKNSRQWCRMWSIVSAQCCMKPLRWNAFCPAANRVTYSTLWQHTP